MVTTWDGGALTAFSHDIVVSDKRNPRVNANGNVFFGDWHNDSFTMINPAGNSDTTIPVPSIDDRFSMQPFTRQSGWANPSPTWGNEIIIQDYIASGSLTMDQKGRVWLSARVSKEAPAFCRPARAIRMRRSTDDGRGQELRRLRPGHAEVGDDPHLLRQ